MSSNNQCFKLINNFTEISNNSYIFNNNYDTDLSYGLYENSENNYSILNIPKSHPLGFYIDGTPGNRTHESSLNSIITYSVSSEPIIIYVSRGNDISYNNGDYFRFYDESFNLINIEKSYISNGSNYNLTDGSDNFYFMRNATYKFIATHDFSSVSPFGISGSIHNIDLSLNIQNNLFNLKIPSDASSTSIFYYDLCNTDISVNLQILIDASNIEYYYGDISFTIHDLYSTELSNNNLSIKSFDSGINNTNLFSYSSTCQYIIQGSSELSQTYYGISMEALNYISKANISYNTNIYYEFNKLTHPSKQHSNYKNIDFILFDGSYIIFDICSNYAITIDNSNIQSNIYIDENYYRTKKYVVSNNNTISYEKTHHQTYNYYYDALKIIVNYNDNNISNDLIINIILYDVSNNKTYELSNNFIYSELNENPDIINGFENDQSNFKLLNQKGNQFELSYNTYTDNIYTLNRFENYIEPGFVAQDKYGHDLSFLVIIDPLIQNNGDICYNDLSFSINYIFVDYNENTNYTTRKINIYKGPFIEISGVIINYFENQNPYTNNFNIPTNITSDISSYDFLQQNSIEVYYYDDNAVKNYLPFDLTLSGEYYGSSCRDGSSIDQSFTSVNIINYSPDIKEQNNNKTRYISNNLSIQNGLLINNIQNISTITNELQNFLNTTSNSQNITYNTQDNNIILKTTITGPDYRINDISVNYPINIINITLQNSINDFDISLIIYKSSYNIDFSFNLYITEKDRTNDNIIGETLNINGEFLQPYLLENKIGIHNNSGAIDLKYIGNYDLLIDVKGLNSNDFIYDSISGFIDTSLITQRIININVIDNIDPSLEFITNNDSVISASTILPIDVSFNIYDLIEIKDVSALHITEFQDQNVPHVNYIDNSIYNSTISYEISIDTDASILDHMIRGQDNSSAIIRYFATDLCGNKSDYITYTISFEDIPFVELSGNLVETIEVLRDTSYIDAGIKIDSSFVTQTILNFQDSSSGSLSLSDGQINISYSTSTNFSLNIIGNYTITYDVTINETVSKTRTIIVEKTTKPHLTFQDRFYYNTIDFWEYQQNNVISNGLFSDPSFVDAHLTFMDRILVMDAFDSTTASIMFKVPTNSRFKANLIFFKSIVYNDNTNTAVSISSNVNIKIKKGSTSATNIENIDDNDFQDQSISLTLSSGDTKNISFELNSEESNILFIFQKSIDIRNFYFIENIEIIENTIIDSNYSSNIIDFTLTYTSTFADLSSIIYDFYLYDNYFYISDISYEIFLSISGESDISFNSSNTSNILTELSNKNYLTDASSNSNFENLTISNLNNTLDPIIFKYKISDPCNNITEFNRKVNIIDIESPSINFGQASNTDFSYVLYDSSNINFSYEAINYNYQTISFEYEISSILFNFDLSDAFDICQNNYVLTISANDFSLGDIKSIIDISNKINDTRYDISLQNLFKNVGTFFEIIYDFSDNQGNDAKEVRTINIVNNLKPNIDLCTNLFTISNEQIDISFGDICFNINDFFILSHARLEDGTDISLDLSYDLTNESRFDIINRNQFYDVSSLIYQIPINDGNGSKYISFDISFYVHAYNYNYSIDICSNINDISSIKLNLINYGPVFTIPTTSLSFEGGIPISDLSLIQGVQAYSIYDEFYYNNYSTDISYTETNFIISSIINQNDNSLSLNQQNPVQGNYTITYSATDQNNVTKTKTRLLEVIDIQGPIIDLNGETSITIKRTTNYEDPPITFKDLASDLSYIKIELEFNSNINFIKSYSKIDGDLSGNLYNYISNNTINNTINSIIRSNSSVKNFTIIYTAYDVKNLDSSNNRTINIDINNFDFTFSVNISEINITLDASFNEEFIINKTNFPEDLSMSFDIETNTITYEAYDPENIIDFLCDVIYNDNISLTTEEIIIINNIDYIVPGNYKIYFQAIKDSNNELRFVDFNIIDTRPPILTFISNSDYNNIERISLPLLSNDSSNNTYQVVSNTINYFINNNNITKNLFVRKNDKIIFSVTGINIDDNVDGYTITLSNETIDNINNKHELFQLDVSYQELSGNNIYPIDPNNLLTNSGIYIQTYSVFDSNRNYIDISRILIVEKQKPIINLNYEVDYNDNIYKKLYHRRYELYENFNDLKGSAFDYYFGDLSFNENNIDSIIDPNKLGLQQVSYSISNEDGLLSTIEREIHVVEIDCATIDISFDLLKSQNITNNRYGLYNGSYNIKIDNSSNAIRLKNTYNYDVSNLISIRNDCSYVNYEDTSYCWGNITIDVSYDFNRISIEYLEDSTINILEDIFLYTDKCDIKIINDTIDTNNIKQEFIVDVSNINSGNGTPYFTLSGENFQAASKKDLVLSLGKYKFRQNSYKNFYNPIKFSYIRDGWHNKDNSNNFTSYNDISYQQYEYSKNVYSNSLAGVLDGHTIITLDATTPSPLYYYCKNFPNMGGKIETKNNIIISKDFTSLNGNILNRDSSNILTDMYYCNSSSIKVFNHNVLQNKLLLSCKLISNIDSSYNNVIALTHQNINHNIHHNISNNKLIFHNYSSSTDSSNIKHDVSDNYLFSNFANNLNSNIFMYKYQTYTLNTNDIAYIKPEQIKHTLNLDNLYYTNNLINNYAHFFRRNNLINDHEIVSSNFGSKVEELGFTNIVNFLDGGQIYNFFEGNNFLSNNLVLDSILDNNIRFELYTNYNTNSRQYDFATFSINILSTISGDRVSITKLTRDNLLFYKYTEYLKNDFIIELNNTVLDSVGPDLSSILFNDSTNTYNEELLKDRIYLNVYDSSNSNTGIKNFIGLTQQNLYHNMFYDSDNKLIFHKYQENMNNYIVNYPGLTLQQTLDLSKNNNLYLLEISTNDVYNCFVNSSENIFENFAKKNSYFEISNNDQITDVSFTTHINYFVFNELENDNVYLENFDIVSHPLNKINYLENPNTYAESLQKTHSHSYIFDLNDYFDRNFYTLNNKLQLNPNFINLNNLYYVIKDISYINHFNIYDIDASNAIIYDKTAIEKLNIINNSIYPINFKIEYIKKLYYIFFPANTVSNNISTIDLLDNQDILEFKHITQLYQAEINYNNYKINLQNNSLNKIFIQAFNNSKKLFQKFNETKFIIEYFTGNIIETIDASFSINYFDINIDKLFNDVSNVQSLIDKIYDNILYYYVTDISIFNNKIINNETTFGIDSSQNFLHKNNYENIDDLLKCYNDYNTLIKGYTNILFELDLRNDIYSYDDFIDEFNALYSNLSNISIFYEKLLTGFVNIFKDLNINGLNGNFDTQINGISFTTLHNENPEYNFNYDDFSANIIKYTTDSSFVNNFIDVSNVSDLLNLVNDLSNCINYFKLATDEIFSYSGKINIFDDINYIMSGSKLLINSFQSNNILIKYDIFYNSALYPDKYLNTNVLDLAFPDITPPTIIFKDNDTSLNETQLVPSEIDEVIQMLLDNIKYIDIYQDYNSQSNYYSNDICLNNTSYEYINYDSSTNDLCNNIIYDSLITIDLTNIASLENDGQQLDIIYTIKDNANNINIIRKGISVSKEFFDPQLRFYINDSYKNITTSFIRYDNGEIIDLIIDEGDSEELIKDKAKNNFSVLDIALRQTEPSLNDVEIEIFQNDHPNSNSENIDVSYNNSQPQSVRYKIYGKYTTIIATRNIIINPIIQEEEEEKEEIKTHCCYPKVYYKPIQHNYKLGSSNTSVMRLSKIIVNNIR